MKSLLLIAPCLLLHFLGSAQIVMHLQLPPSGIMLKEQLWNLSLLNSGTEEAYARVEMELSDVSNNQRILTAVTREFSVPKGIKQIRQADILPLTYNVINPSYPVDASPGGFLPIGSFNVCFRVVKVSGHSDETIGDECDVIEVEPVSPPSLVLPEDEERTDVIRPVFTWVPPAPLNLFTRLSYDFVLVELLPTQNPTDAVLKNIPICTASDINFTNFAYPSSLRELDTAKTYAWRIRAKNNGLYIANSETWSFKVVRESEKQGGLLDHAYYIKLSKSQDASFSICTGVLHFEYANEPNNPSVNINLFDITNASRTEVVLQEDKTAEWEVGSNFGNIDLKKNKSMINNHMYLLELTSGKDKWYMKFLFTKK